MIELTEFQKWIIDAILSGDINSYRTFSYKFGEIVKMKIENKLTDRDVPKRLHTHFQNSKEDYITSLKEYFSLVIKLNRNGLIILINNKISNKEEFLTMKDTDFMHFNMEDYRHKEIISLPELQSFVKRGYRTYSGMLSEKESRRPWRIAMLITAVSVIINMGVLAFQIWGFPGKEGLKGSQDILRDGINVRINDEVKVIFKDPVTAQEKVKEVKKKK